MMEHQGQLHPFLEHFRYHHDEHEDHSWGEGSAVVGQTPFRQNNNQHFVNHCLMEELPPLDTWAMMKPHHPPPLSLSRRNSGISEITCNKEEFQVKLNVDQFRPEELTAKIAENYVVVHGQHDGQEDGGDHTSRHFKRRYRLPDNATDSKMEIDLSSDGILQIRVPRSVEVDHQENHHSLAEKMIPINQTGKPAVVAAVATRDSENGGGDTNNGHHFHSLTNA